MLQKLKYKLKPCLSLDFLNKGFLPYLLLAVLFLVFYLTFDQSKTTSNYTMNVQLITLASIALLSFLGIISAYFNQFQFKHLLLLIIVIGIILRLDYIFVTDIHTRQHDVENLNSTGHLSYIFYIFKNWALPPYADWQFSHPPLHYFISAVFCKLGELLGFSQARMFESIQFLTAFYSSSCIFVFYKILMEFKEQLSKPAILLALSLISFNPTFIILSGSINNDMLMIFLFSVSLLYIIRWYKNPTYKPLLLSVFALGLSMMAKLSGGVLAPVIAVLFLAKLIEMKKGLWKQYFAFFFVAAPLGFWHPIRNLLLFHLPIGYVNPISVESALYNGNHSILERFFSFPLSELTTKIFANPFGDFSLPAYIVKCSLFGEYSFKGTEPLALVFIFINIFLIIISLLSMVYFVIINRSEKNRFFTIVFFINWLVQIGAFIMLNIKLPFGCTMDYRYIVPTLFSGISFLALFISQHQKSKVINYMICVLAFLFCACTVLFTISLR